jgi:catechol 2,3-dioxygenase-like lactoylglutathione lyase family enzyme
MLTRLEYPILYASDPSRSRDFFVSVLKCEVDEDLGYFVELRLGSSRLALNQANTQDKLAGYQTIVVASNDVQGDYERISKLAKVLEPLTDAAWGKTFIFLDPDGNKIEVVED